ncbi:MAG: cupin-like domain-containing protein [Pseudomonadota bacterium]
MTEVTVNPSGCSRSQPVDFLSLASESAAVDAAIAARQPVVLTDLAADWPALSEWTPDNLSSRYGDKRVRVYDASFGEPGANYMGSVDAMSFAEFLQATLGEGRDLRMFLYNISHHVPELLDDVILPDIGLRFSRRFVFTFFGCQGAVTPLHYDIDMGHVFYTAIHGRRRIRLFAPDQAAALYQHPFTVRAYANLERPDYGRHPALKWARGFEVVLQPGQTLFLPAGYWHEFHYLDAGFGVSLRASSPAMSDRLRGAANLLLLSPLDRIANKVAANGWFDFKERSAQRRAQALIQQNT